MTGRVDWKAFVSTCVVQAAWTPASPHAPLGSPRPPLRSEPGGGPAPQAPLSKFGSPRAVWLDRVIGLGCVGWLVGLACVVMAPDGSWIYALSEALRAVSCVALVVAMALRGTAAARRGSLDAIAWTTLLLAPATLGAILGVLLHDAGVRVERVSVDLPPIFPWLLGEVLGISRDALVGALVAVGVAGPACALAAVASRESGRAGWLRVLDSSNLRRDLLVTAGMQLSGLVLAAVGCVLATRLEGVTFIPKFVGTIVRSDGMRLVVVALALLPLPFLAGYVVRFVMASDSRSSPGAHSA